MTRVHRRILLLLAAAAMLALAGATAQTSAGSRSAKGANPVLKVVFPTTGADVMIHLAQSLGYFAKHGVDVEFTENAGANALPILVSGQADLEVNTVAAIPLLTSQGKDVQAIYAMGGGGQGGSLIASTKTDIKTIADLQALKGRCKIGSGPSPQATFGYANYYNEKYKLGCDVVPLGTVGTQLAALSNGSTDVLVTAIPNITSAITAGVVRVIIDTRLPKQRVGNFLEVALFAQKSTIQSRSADIAKFLAGLNDAAKYFRGHYDLAVARKLTSFSNWSTLSDQDIATGVVGGLRPYIMVNQDWKGYIWPARWKLALHWLTYWGLPNFNENSAQVSYANEVAMGPYVKGIGKPTPLVKPKKKK
jgi:ABC-type nitrate/sulfonate/bicarbonate transport system substrate-binding protein